MKNTSIKLPKQFYVGLKTQQHTESGVPLGFATPYEPNTPAYEKRKGTVDFWCRSDNYTWDPETRKNIQKPIPDPVIIDNTVPLTGFKIADSVRRVYWGGGNVVWRIEDPRGFELEISSSNFAKIIDCTTIVNGEIMMSCVWGRDKSQNVLLPTNSDPYQEAAENTSRIGQKVPLKDVSIGDTVVLKNGTVGIYAGAFNIVSVSSKDGHGSRSNWNGSRWVPTRVVDLVDIKRKYMLKIKLTKDTDAYWSYTAAGFSEGDDVFINLSDITISSIKSKTSTPQSFITEIQEINQKTKHSYCGMYGAYYITDKPIKVSDVVMSSVPATAEEVSEIVKHTTSNESAGGYNDQPMFIYDGKLIEFIKPNRFNIDDAIVFSNIEWLDSSTFESHSLRGTIQDKSFTRAQLTKLVATIGDSQYILTL